MWGYRRVVHKVPVQGDENYIVYAQDEYRFERGIVPFQEDEITWQDEELHSEVSRIHRLGSTYLPLGRTGHICSDKACVMRSW